MDKFYEQFIGTKKNSSYTILNVVFFITGAIAVLFLMQFMTAFNLVLGALFVVFGVLAFLSMKARDKQYREFEYIFTNGNLQIDAIYNMKKRKTIMDEDVNNFEDFGKASEMRLAADVKKINCYPWDKKGEVYIVLLGGTERRAFYITPDENLLKMIGFYNRKIRR
jgi:hypothetical protein